MASPETKLSWLQRAPFFEPLDQKGLVAIAKMAEVQQIDSEQRIFTQGDKASHLYMLVEGQIALSFEDPMEAKNWVEVRNIARSGRVLGWSALVKPFCYRASATASKPIRLLAIPQEPLYKYCKDNPAFGVQFMERILWVLGNRLRSTRIRLIAKRYDEEIYAIRALLDQSAEILEVGSPLHKIPHYLENRLTVEDAFNVLGAIQAHGTEAEKNVAEDCLQILDKVRRELRIFHRLQRIFEHVTGASVADSPEEIRTRCTLECIELFKNVDFRIEGEDNLPDKAGNLIILNHLGNHPDNVLPNGFAPILDTHFVSSMILYKKYGTPPMRVVRYSYSHEFGHKRYYERLGYVQVLGGRKNLIDEDFSGDRKLVRSQFFDECVAHLNQGQNLVICPEGAVSSTEKSPQAFKTGAFRLALAAKPEPLIVPIAVANFDKKLTQTRVVAIIHPPFRLSEKLPAKPSDEDLRCFVEGLNQEYRQYVREAVERSHS